MIHVEHGAIHYLHMNFKDEESMVVIAPLGHDDRQVECVEL